MSPQFLWSRWLAQHVARLAGQVGHCPASRWARLHQRHSALPGRLALIASPASLSTAAWPRQLRVEVTVDAVAAHVAERLHRALEQAAVLGLATGRTMEPVYAALLSRILALVPAEREPLLARWRSFNLDEDVGLAADHPASFAAFMRQQVGDSPGSGGPVSAAARWRGCRSGSGSAALCGCLGGRRGP